MLTAVSPGKSIGQFKRLWPAAARLQLGLHGLYTPAMWQAGAAVGLGETAVETLAFVLGNFDVAPLSAELMWQRMPYKSITIYDNMLRTLADNRLAAITPDYGYFLTDKARQTGWQIYDAKHRYLARVDLVPAASQRELAAILHRLQHQSRVLPGLPDRRWLMSRNTYLRHDASDMARITEYLADLNAYRDDSYLSSWQHLGVSGHAWEIVNLLWKRGPQPWEDVCSCLAGRGHTSGESEAARHALMELGWVTTDRSGESVYELTAVGLQVCHRVESETDSRFYQPWLALGANELFRLESILTHLVAAVNGRHTLLPV